MSISSTLNTALSGLVASSRSAEIVSSNISNALTEGYGTRDVSLSARSPGGVSVNGIVRVFDSALIGDRLIANAELGADRTVAQFYDQLETVFGTPDDPMSFTGRVSALEAAMIESGARPDSQARLQGLLDASLSLARTINEASDAIQGLREDADREISAQVQRLNSGVNDVARLNESILRARTAGRDASALFDQRQQVIDGIAEIVPVQVIARENDTVALITPTGAVLLDPRPMEIEFSPRGVITPDMTLESGALSGLSLNGVAISTTGQNGPINGGSLAASFRVRDELAVQAQVNLDAFARDLLERFQDPAVDPTLMTGDPGIFTDLGLAFDPANEVGLSARIAVNERVNPLEGGALWRLRDGLGSTAPGLVGNNTVLANLNDALTELGTPLSGEITSVARSSGGLAGDLLSIVSVASAAAEREQGFSSARLTSLRGLELSQGVDTDQELQKLLLIEQAYAANARVVTTASEMIDTLLAI